MSDIETRFHEEWLGMVQPVDGLVVAVPVLADAQCMQRNGPEKQAELLALLAPVDGDDVGRRIPDLDRFLETFLGLGPDLFDRSDALPEDLSLYVPEGGQTLRPTLGLRKLESPIEGENDVAGDSTPASRAGARYAALLWDLPDGLELDRAEKTTGPWDYPASAKFDRLLRHCRVPVGMLTNRRVMRLVYAPHGESSGSITFRLRDMATVGGRPILDACVMLLGANRFFGAAPEHQLPSLLAESRKRQANVTNALAAQVFSALETLLRGFEAADERDGGRLLRPAMEEGEDHVYGGLLTVLLRLVFVLYAEDRDLLPVQNEFYARNLSALGLFDQLQEDHGAYPDAMNRRFGAWGRLLALFRAIFVGADHGDLKMPARRGHLFDPHAYPFLEGRRPGESSPINSPEAQSAVRVPTLDDETVFRVLEKLVVFEGQRLSYRTLDVEQIGSVYEALMGYHVQRIASPAVCLRPDRVWVTAEEAVQQSGARLEKWSRDEWGLATDQSKKLAAALKGAKDDESVLSALDAHQERGTERALPGRLVLQPGAERRRTSSHYTPRSLSAPIVRKTLEPLLSAMGGEPTSEQLLSLAVCDPAMGSGAFLVEACRFLGDQVVAAWTREGKLALVADAHDDVVNHARRLVAQRCLYGVDKNPYAVHLAKLSLWLVTLAKDEPFSFVDHALRHGDSLVGLDFEQIKSFHWKPGPQVELCRAELGLLLDEAVKLRQEIRALAGQRGPGVEQEKNRLLFDAEDALDKARLIADLAVAAFFSADNDKARNKERNHVLPLVTTWLERGGEPPAELVEAREALREGRESQPGVSPLHWGLEFPEVFYVDRPDPLDAGCLNRSACMDAFIGNPPFAGKNTLSEVAGPTYLEWLVSLHAGAHGNADLSAHFFRRAASLLGAHGTIGLIATNTISQGDTRSTGLRYLITREGFSILDATRSMTWPGAAAVSVSVVALGKGRPRDLVRPRQLDDVVVDAINSQLRAGAERSDPLGLSVNAGHTYTGVRVSGAGFLLTGEERRQALLDDADNGAVIAPYLGGEEANSDPKQEPHRFVINFGRRTLDEAGAWQGLLGRVERLVKPLRDAVRENVGKGGHGKKYWWQFVDRCDPLYQALGSRSRCLVAANVSKHLVFSWQPIDRIFANTLCVFALDTTSAFAVLQSRVHELWARMLSSSLEDRLRYAPSDCFETFPFPAPDPRTVFAALEDIGAHLYEARARYMVETQQGLTQTYNRLKDPSCKDAPIVMLRALHEDLDRAVLAAYGCDIPVPAFVTPMTDTATKALAAFEDEVIERLFALNAKRAAEEARDAPLAKSAKAQAGGKRGKKVGAAAGQLALEKTEGGDA